MRSAVVDDVVADVFVLAWCRLDQAPRDELPWLLGIARGVLANRRRGEARQQALRDRLAASSVGETQPAAEGFADESAALIRALGGLSRLDQEVRSRPRAPAAGHASLINRAGGSSS